MSAQVSANLVLNQDNMSKENRRLADFDPGLWGDIFLSSPVEMDMDARTQLEYEELKENHVQVEDDLCTTAVRFLLLREHGFDVHCDTFNKFKDENGKFKESLISDVKGMLKLYEAANFQVHGEDILEVALSFTKLQLKLAEPKVDYPLSAEIAGALNRSLRKSLPRLVARSYIPIYEAYGSHDQNLLKFAKLDFKILQHLHKKEIKEISRWWKSLDFVTNFPFARDRMVECYLWANGVYFEPHYSIARTFLTKVICLTSLIDDIYDAYGTNEELELFTNAINRWDINCIDQLPEYMKKMLYHTLKSYYAEFKWLQENYIPTFEEYMSVALVTSTFQLFTVVAFVGMEDSITKETFIWEFNYPKILRASTIISRLMDDVVTHQFEREREHPPSAVECYMKQYGAPVQAAYDELNKQIKSAWMDMTEGFLKPTEVPTSALDRILNLSRGLDLFYQNDDGYTFVCDSVKDGITSLLIEPISV
ncbi:Detected protein of unknown function [Hibiscus syriacus]|uniref:Uncharacterized protein n=1 Tax=Hibiscus syriacus TaxID=106335 RepID=A0A6A2YGE1_HIBSY|nr:Detected protein of unknown function [Hibiscus syriacus]